MLGVFSALALYACEGEYPLAPTACDDWCHLTENVSCEFYSPSSCVRQCEESGYSSRCAAELHAAMECIKDHLDKPWSCFGASDGSMQCVEEYGALINCGSTHPRE